MSYTEANLLPDERIVLRSFGHWVALLPPVALTLTALAAWWIVPDILADGNPSEAFYIPPYPRFGPASLKAFGVIVTLGVAWFLFAWMRHRTSEFAITNRRVLVKRGIVFRKAASLFIERVESVYLTQTITGRLLGFGTLVVAGTGETREVLSLVPRPQKFRRALQAQAARLRPALVRP